MESFDDFWVKLHVELVEFAAYSRWDCGEAAIRDGSDFLEKTKDEIKRWCALLGDGKLSQDEFAHLLARKKYRADLAALRRSGLPEEAIDRFVDNVIATTASTAYKYFAG